MKLDLPRDPEFQAGVWYSTRASTWYPTHYHDELEVKLVLWGRTVYRIGTEEVAFGPGSLLWLAPGQEHSLLEVSDDLAMWVASFRDPTVRRAEITTGTHVLDRRSGWGACSLPPVATQALSAAYAETVHYQEPRLVNPSSQRLLATALGLWREHGDARELAGSFVHAPGVPLHDAVRRARDLLVADGERRLSLGVLARRCGLDGARLSRLFKRQMGLSLVKFRNHLLVQEFIARFDRGEQRNMLQVALDAGFGSYPQFHRAFHQVTGYAPSEHLQRVRAGLVFPTHQGFGATLSLNPRG